MTNLYRDEILDAGALPIQHVAYTPCFRREKMTAGRDVRGIKRGHQFDKVEMVKFVRAGDVRRRAASRCSTTPRTSAAASACRIAWSRCAPATSRSSPRMKYDVEVWAPGCGEWLEVSSCSNFRDFQARRANIRYRPAPRAKPELVHTLNGSGLALPRVMIAVLETYQQADGSVDRARRCCGPTSAPT